MFFTFQTFLLVPTRAPTSGLSCYYGDVSYYYTTIVPYGYVCVAYCSRGIIYYEYVSTSFAVSYTYTCTTNNCNYALAVPCTRVPSAIPTSARIGDLFVMFIVGCTIIKTLQYFKIDVCWCAFIYIVICIYRK